MKFIAGKFVGEQKTVGILHQLFAIKINLNFFMQEKPSLAINDFRLKVTKLYWCSNSGTVEQFSVKLDSDTKKTR